MLTEEGGVGGCGKKSVRLTRLENQDRDWKGGSTTPQGSLIGCGGSIQGQFTTKAEILDYLVQRQADVLSPWPLPAYQQASTQRIRLLAEGRDPMPTFPKR